MAIVFAILLRSEPLYLNPLLMEVPLVVSVNQLPWILAKIDSPYTKILSTTLLYVLEKNSLHGDGLLESSSVSTLEYERYIFLVCMEPAIT